VSTWVLASPMARAVGSAFDAIRRPRDRRCRARRRMMTQVHGAIIELAVGIALLSCAAPTRDGLTVGERVRIGVDFMVRSRWTSVQVTKSGKVVTIVAHGAATVRGFELQHRGRLDLSGRDQQNVLALEEFADALATSKDTRHFSLHVRTSPNHVATLLAVPRT